MPSRNHGYSIWKNLSAIAGYFRCLGGSVATYMEPYQPLAQLPKNMQNHNESPVTIKPHRIYDECVSFWFLKYVSHRKPMFFKHFWCDAGRHSTQKGEHSYGFLYIFLCENGGHSPTLKKTQRPAQLLSNDILAQSQCPIAAAEGAKLSKMSRTTQLNIVELY